MPSHLLLRRAQRAFAELRIRRQRSLATPLRCSPLSTLQLAAPENVVVPCRSNGAVTLSIYRSRDLTQPTPVLIYLPAGLALPGQSDDYEDASISALLDSSSSTVVRINYRLSERHQFPTPVHDVLTAYDWILHNLVKSSTTGPTNGRTASRLARLGVYGELVGGGLAAMLALTECKLGASRIGAAAINNPVVDWVFPDELAAIIKPEPRPGHDHQDESYEHNSLMDWWAQQEAEEEATPKSPKRVPKVAKSSWKDYAHNPALPTSALLQSREVFFKKKEDYFDRFASPICFFRSPKGELVYPEHEDILASSSPPTSDDDSPSLDPDLSFQEILSEADSHKPRPAPALPTLLRCRAYYRGFPPSHLDLDLPFMHITTGSESPLLDQASEYSGMVKRAVAHQFTSNRHTRDTRDSQEIDQLKAKAQEIADRKVSLKVQDGLGLLTGSSSSERWKNGVEEVGSWMKARIKA
ncbi:alpha/beta-hydrolase [Lophium mytilinum]|uniref:Alpha/beta-hydrolase n=1 Tax=Lophium mytilinum TaxID=390894 RepID=A0A6A6QQL4_9PEZI|nr:alpha/beta-hydrolase [Lophium mytilinum]